MSKNINTMELRAKLSAWEFAENHNGMSPIPMNKISGPIDLFKEEKPVLSCLPFDVVWFVPHATSLR